MAFVRRPPVVSGGGRVADAAVGLVGGVKGGMMSLSGPADHLGAIARLDLSRSTRRQPALQHGDPRDGARVSGVGLLDGTFWIWAAMCLPTTLIAAHIGLKLYGRVNDVQFRWLVLALLSLSGATLIVSAL